MPVQSKPNTIGGKGKRISPFQVSPQTKSLIAVTVSSQCEDGFIVVSSDRHADPTGDAGVPRHLREYYLCREYLRA